MRKGRMAATRFFIIVIILMTFFVLSGPTVFARQGPPQIPPGKDIVDENKDDKHEDKNRGWDKVVEKFIENGIIPPAHVNNELFDYIRDALEAEEEDYIQMVTVGEQGVDYLIPTRYNDSQRATVAGGYKMAIHQTTYELWYEVRVWAEANGYHFQNLGREGNSSAVGAEPTERMLEPVTTVTWGDVIVWTNALSEMIGLDPVYRTSSDDIIRDSRDANGNVVDAVIETSNNGYRMPTRPEWEMAARWKNDTESTDGSILVGGRWWTRGSYASGATAPWTDADATQAVAWYAANSGYMTQPVGQLTPNHLGIYDMSGNVWQWTYTTTVGVYRVLGGGCYFNNANRVQIGDFYSTFTFDTRGANIGFRIVRNP